MTKTFDWQRNHAMWTRVLVQQTGEGVAHWNARIAKAKIKDESGLRTWLARQGVTGYAQSLLVMERFGYPTFITTPADVLIDNQYAPYPALRPIYDDIIAAAERIGEIAIQARKTYVSVLTPRRTFARLLATRAGLCLGLRIDGAAPRGKLTPSRIHPTMQLQTVLTSRRDLDAAARTWLKRAYNANT